MNVLLLTLIDVNSIKEAGIYTDLMREFAKKNHKVYIVSPIESRKRQAAWLINEEDCKILKLQIGKTQKTNIIEKGLSIVMLESKVIKGINRYFADIKFDLVLYSTPPITLQRAVRYIKRRDNAKTYLLLKDIFPQNAVDLGVLSKKGLKGIIYRYFRKKEEQLYEQSDYIGCMSEANIEFVLHNNPKISPNTVEVCPNSIEPKEIVKEEINAKEIREQYQIPSDKTVFIYGGNLGKPQGIDFLIKCINENKYNKKAFFVIVGSGTELRKLQGFFSNEKPSNAIMINQLPKDEYEKLENACDVGLVFLDHRFTIPNFPSRILSYMQASLPVFAATDINTDIGNIITKGCFGYWCESDDVREFSNKLLELCEPELRKQMGRRARNYLESHYTAKHSYDIIMKHFEQSKGGS